MFHVVGRDAIEGVVVEGVNLFLDAGGLIGRILHRAGNSAAYSMAGGEMGCEQQKDDCKEKDQSQN